MKKFEPILQAILIVAIIVGGMFVYDMGSKTNSNTELISFKLDTISSQLSEIKTPASRVASPEPVQSVQKVSYSIQSDDFALDDDGLDFKGGGDQVEAGRLKEQLDRLEAVIAKLEGKIPGTLMMSPGVQTASDQTGAFEPRTFDWLGMQGGQVAQPSVPMLSGYVSQPSVVITSESWEVPSVPVAPAVPSGYGSTGTAPPRMQSSQFTRSVQNTQPRTPIRTGVRNLLGVPLQNTGSGRRAYCVDQFGRRVSCN